MMALRIRDVVYLNAKPHSKEELLSVHTVLWLVHELKFSKFAIESS
jgi:hypothetical protein